MPPKDKYSDPGLRDEVKEEVKQSDKGGAPGQWSARKAQFMASEYKRRGGGYRQDKSQQDDSQKNLSKWTAEEWQTKEGSGNAKKADGTQKRYLPKKVRLWCTCMQSASRRWADRCALSLQAWEQMSQKEKNETDAKKQTESKKGKQFVGNTEQAKRSRKKVSAQLEDDVEQGDQDDVQQKDQKEQQDEKKSSNNGRGQKRKTSAETKQSGDGNGGNKASKKTHGSKHDSTDAPAQQASKDRLPDIGTVVTWKAMPGWVKGEVTEIVRQSKTVNGKSVKASNDDPHIVLKSHGPSGKLAVHKPEAVYFD